MSTGPLTPPVRSDAETVCCCLQCGRAAAGKLRCVGEFVEVVVETPRNSRNVYEVDQQGQVRFDRRLPGSFAYPADYSYIVGATGSDGEPPDALELIPRD